MTSSNTVMPGHLRRMKLGEFDQMLDLLEVAFADDAAREGRNFRDDMAGIKKMLPILKLLFKVPGMEDHFTTLVWTVDNRFASAVTISRQGSDRECWYIFNVSTQPDYRGRGLARKLVTAALDHIRARGGQRVLLDVRVDNDPAYQLYRSLGFLHLESSATLKGTARHLSPSISDFDLRLLSSGDWRPRYELEQLLASDATKTVCPPTRAQFKSSAIMRSIESILGRAQQIARAQWMVERAGQPIGLISCAVHQAGSSPHHVNIAFDPHQAGAAPAMLTHAINACAAQRADYPLLITLSDRAPIDWLCQHGFVEIETMHQLGMNLSEQRRST